MFITVMPQLPLPHLLGLKPLQAQQPARYSLSDTTAAASMASVALCAELARRLDLLSQRVWQLEQQLLNRK